MRLSEYIAELERLAAVAGDPDLYIFTPPDDHGSRYMVVGAELKQLNPMGGPGTNGPNILGVELQTRHASHHVDLGAEYNKLLDAWHWRVEQEADAKAP